MRASPGRDGEVGRQSLLGLELLQPSPRSPQAQKLAWGLGGRMDFVWQLGKEQSRRDSFCFRGERAGAILEEQKAEEMPGSAQPSEMPSQP